MKGIGWLKNPSVGLLLLPLMCMTASVSNPKETIKCPNEDFLTEEGACCDKCHAGYKLVENCNATGQRTKCIPCPPNEFMEHINSSPNCRRCRRCKEKNNEFTKTACTPHQDTVCQCKEGYYKSIIDSLTYECLQCKSCQSDERQIQKCTENKNTECGCQENYHKVKGKCEPCKNCTEPKRVITTAKPVTGNNNTDEWTISLILGVFCVGLVLLLLAIAVTYVVTKRFVKKEKSTTFQPSSSDSCQKILVIVDEPLVDCNATAITQTLISEQEPTNLPDCVPLEIKIPDLIYTVLDLVPVPQMKQLVRSLGLKDTEIEQVEMDHRSCKEAHYQMLRMWAERSPRAVRGGRGGMLHRPLLEELLDKLRQIHLGWAADELETKYGIQ